MTNLGRGNDVTEWTLHGGNLSHAMRAFPDAPGPWLDLSTGINPDPWPIPADFAIDWHRLPDAEALAALEQAAAAHIGTDPARVLALPGTEMGLRAIATLGLPAPLRHVAPGYRTHAQALGDSRPIAFADIGQEAGRGGTILFANPANPDGWLSAGADMLALAETLAAQDGWLVVDEAFVDAQDDASIAPLLGPDAPVIVMRSFGKFFGLAGVRLGFAVGPVALIDRWRASLGSWPLSGAAIAIGTAAYRDTDWIAATRSQLVDRAAALDAVLARHGLTATGACPLFRLIDCDAAALFPHLARQGILTRPFDYDPRWLRLGVPATAQHLDRLDQALAHG